MQEELAVLAQIAGPGELGSLTLAAENARETWGWTWLESIVADLRYAFRMLKRQPGFVAVAVVSLALGMGANSAIFSLADALLLRPLPVVQPSEVLTISDATPDTPVEGTSYPDYREIREHSRSFSGVIAYRMTSLGVSAGSAAQSQMRLGLMVSDNFFGVLGIAPSAGRAFVRQEGEVPGRDRVAVLAHEFWERQYASDPSAIGRTLRLNGVELTIIGVAPESFPGLDRFARPSVYVPLSMWGALEGDRTDPMQDRNRHDLSLKGRLKPGVSQQSAQAELAIVAQNLARANPKTNRDLRFEVLTEIQARIQQVRQLLMFVAMLMTLAGLVLTIACVNVANLFLARARARSREIAIRLAIGAGRARLVRQLLTESLVVALLGGIAGLAVGYGAIQFLGTMQTPSDIPFTLGLKLDTRVLAFTVCVALVSCLLFGLAPALQAARFHLVPALKAGGEGVLSRRGLLGRNILVVSQIAIAMVLLIAAGIFISGFRKMLVTGPGFPMSRLISMDLDPTVVRYSPQQTHAFYRNLAERTRALPGVKSIALAESIPYSLTPSSVTVVPEGYQFTHGRENVTVYGGAFDESYFNTMKIPIVRGRGFSVDDRADSRRVAVVNEEFAKTYWPNQDPVGKRLRLGRPDGAIVEVVGVAKTERYLFPTEPPVPYVYLPYEQNQRSRMTLIAASQGDPATLAGALHEIVRGLDADLPIQNLRTLTSFYDKRVVSNWLMLVDTVATMGLVGLTLAVVGLYGLISYSVSCKTREMGIRMAIGASQASVLGLVLRQGLILAVAGVGIGGALTVLLVRPLATALGILGELNIGTFIIVPAALLTVGVAACYLPARRAATLDPMRSLRWE